MTAKRITIGAKPMLVGRETSEIEPGAASTDVAATSVEFQPRTSAEEWLRGGETSLDERAEGTTPPEPVASEPAYSTRTDADSPAMHAVPAVPAGVAHQAQGRPGIRSGLRAWRPSC